MRDRSARIILGAGLVVLAAQLVVWLTPARNLIVDTAENPTALDLAGKNRTTAPSALNPEDEGVSSEVVIEEPPSAAEKTVAQAPTASEPEAERGVSGESTEETQTTADETVAQAPTASEPEVEREESGESTEETQTTAEEPVAQAPTASEPEVERDVSGDSTEETRPEADETVAQAPAAPEPEAERDVSGDSTEETRPEADETVAQAPTASEPEEAERAAPERDVSGESTEEAPTEADQTVAQAPTGLEPKLERDVSVAATEQAPTATDESLAQPSSAGNLFIAESVKQKLSDPALRKGAHADDLAALEALYAEYRGPARWVTSAGLTPQAQAVVSEITKAEDWGLDANAFRVPPPDFRVETAEDQAAVEVALDVAILQYARAAQGGRVDPSAVSKVSAQTPSVREPETILTEIAAASAPDTYLTALHPKHEQFTRLRQALLKAQSEEDEERLKANMDRWRWMPETLGGTYIWLNIPEFMLHVVKDGKTIQSEKIVVGNPKSPTPVLSANMTAIVFNSERVVPLSIIRRSVLPKLQERKGLFRGDSTSVLEQYQLTVKHKGKPVDPSKIDWDEVNLSQLAFVQAPGPKNVLGKVQFLYPNDRGVSMHDTIFRSQLNQAVRAKGQKEPRVANPEKLAALLLAEGNGWSKGKVDQASKKSNVEVKLDNLIPVHMTYFTAVVDDEGQVKTFDDVYKLDGLDMPEDASDTSTPASRAIPPPSRKPSADGNRSARADRSQPQ